MRVPSNLSRAASRDLDGILERSARVFGEAQARALQRRIYDKCLLVAEGLDHGHARIDMPSDLPLRFVRIGRFLIAYDPATRIVDRIVDGRRDLPRLLRR